MPVWETSALNLSLDGDHFPIVIRCYCQFFWSLYVIKLQQITTGLCQAVGLKWTLNRAIHQKYNESLDHVRYWAAHWGTHTNMQWWYSPCLHQAYNFLGGAKSYSNNYNTIPSWMPAWEHKSIMCSVFSGLVEDFKRDWHLIWDSG